MKNICGKNITILIAVVLVFCFLYNTNNAFAGGASLSWDANTETDLAGYKVYYGTASRTYGNSISVGNVIAHTITELAPGTYFFAATALDFSGNESGYSNEVTKSIVASNTAIISSLTATNQNGAITVTWIVPEFTTIQGYKIYAWKDGTSKCIISNPATSCDIYDVGNRGSFTLFGLKLNTMWHFMVSGYDNSNESLGSTFVSVFITTNGVLPTDVTNLTATTINDTSNKLRWKNPFSNNFRRVLIEFSYNNGLKESIDAGGNILAEPGAFQTFLHSGLTPGFYKYFVHACSDSACTNTAIVEKCVGSCSSMDPRSGTVTLTPPSTPPPSTPPTTPSSGGSSGGCGLIMPRRPGDKIDGDASMKLIILLLFLLLAKRVIQSYKKI